MKPVQMPFKSRETITKQKWVCAALGTILLVVVLYYSFSSNRVRNVAGLWLVFAPMLLGAYSGYQQARFFERLLGNAAYAECLAQYKTVRDKSFDDACHFLEDRAELVSQDNVVMASPSTWGRKQRRETFWEEPFEITILETNGRVAELRVLYKNDDDE